MVSTLTPLPGQFRPEPVYVAGMKIANTVPGYQYAAYARSDIAIEPADGQEQ